MPYLHDFRGIGIAGSIRHTSNANSEEVGEIDIETLTLEQYLALDRNDTRGGIKRHDIRKNVEFEIKGQLLRELCDTALSRNETEDAIEHIKRVLKIASLFNIHGVSGDDIMLRVFPLTLVRTTKRWLGRTSSETITTWDKLKQVFIQRFCPPSVTFKRLGEIHNFRQEEGESLYQAWESYNDLLFKCPFHDLNDYQKEIADHSHKYHNKEGDRRISNNGSNSLSMITYKLKNLNRDMNDVRENVHKIHPKSNKEFCLEEVKSIRTGETKQDNQGITLKNKPPAVRKVKQDTPVESSIPTPDRKEDAMKLEPPCETPIHKVETFTEKVKKRIVENQVKGEKLLMKLESEPFNITLVKDIRKTPEYTRHLQELVSNKTKIKELSLVKLNARCSTVLQNELPPKEKDPWSFGLPCIIGTTMVSNALTDLGASISVMPFSMFKRLGFGNPKLVNMVIEMADRSMQSLKGIVENVLVKLHKFVFSVDFVILDIIEDDKVMIILGRPMLATTYARIDVFGGKISLEVGTEQIILMLTKEPPH
ncbi:retrovirus-related pol polyprotein from transposon TNT 1-94 [Tanacetum coccineum]